MFLQLSNALIFCHNKPHSRNSCSFHVSASLDTGVEREAAKSASVVSSFEETRERIVKLIQKPEISVSTYDTAWVAMVASPHSLQEPCFPDCVDWLLENQCPDGKWAHPHQHRLLQKDVVSSTLACILALKRWGVGEDKINRGIHFIESNFASTTEDNQISPIGFDIIFPGMLEYARDLSLNLNLEPTTLNALIHKRNLELKRCYESDPVQMEAYMAYISEGMGKLQEWNSIMKYQRSNGSLFNSPSTTAAACIFHHNDGCVDYLHSALKKFGNAVPAIYPLNLYAQLCTVDNLERLGISRYFRKEIQSVLDEVYRCWLQGEEEIIMDASTCAIAFRVLRKNGYDVISDQMTKLLEEDCLSGFFGEHMRDINRTLESYRASEIIFPHEATLDKQNRRLKYSLEHELSAGLTYSDELGRNMGEEAKHVLEYPFYAIMKRMEDRRNIEHCNLDSTRTLKTSFYSPNFGDKDFLSLSVADFNKCQQTHREELKELERWVVDNRLDELKFARRKSAYCYFSAAATIFNPELSDARMSWAKNGVLTTVVDDFFDVGGSLEELKNLIHLVEKWDVDVSTECSSQNVEILFAVLKSTICGIGDKAFVRQGRSVTKHIINIWLDVLNTMLKEAEWARDRPTPTLDEYMSNAYTSFALGPIVLPALYLVGPKLSEEMVQHPEYSNLFKLMSTCGRLLNDIQGYERELKESKSNAVSLYMMNGGDEMTKEVAVAELRKMIDGKRRQLHRLVLDRKNSVLPRACKDLFWHMCTVVHLFYIKDDGFTSEDLFKVVNKIIYEPIVLNQP